MLRQPFKKSMKNKTPRKSTIYLVGKESIRLVEIDRNAEGMAVGTKEGDTEGVILGSFEGMNVGSLEGLSIEHDPVLPCEKCRDVFTRNICQLRPYSMVAFSILGKKRRFFNSL